MTREEAITILQNEQPHCGKKLIFTEEEKYEVYNMALEALEQDRWIPVTERLPEESTAVLVWCPERKNIYCAYYKEKRWWIFGAYWEQIEMKIVAWMPLPPSP